MNKPVSGSEYRALGVLHEELKVVANAVPNMTVRVQPGIFYDNSGNLIEFEGGTSSTILAPASGYKWIVVVLNMQGTISIVSGEIKNKAPELPKIEKNQIPLAAIYCGANMTMITQSDICDIRPFWKVGAYAGDHTLLENRNLPDAHSISAITNLQNELDKRVTLEAFEQYDEKVTNISGTNSTVFTLNQIQSGAPTANSALVVKRGTEPDVAIRFNEKNESWEFTNNGIDWSPFLDAVNVDGSLRPATESAPGVVKLSVSPVSGVGTAVADNDPRLAKIDTKADAESVYTKDEVDEKLSSKIEKNDTYSREALDNMLAGKLDVGNAYTDDQIDNLLRGKLNVGDAYLKAEVDNSLFEKADKADIYSKEELDAKFAQSNERITVNAEQIATKASADSVYTKEEVDAAVQNVDEKVEGITVDFDNYKTITDGEIERKANASDVYDKATVDEKVDTLTTDLAATTDALNNYITANDEEISKKANVDNVYTKDEVDAALSGKATVSEVEQCEDKIESLSQDVRELLVDALPQVVNQNEYQLRNSEVDAKFEAANATIAANKSDVDAYKALNDTAVNSKVSTSDFAQFQNEMSQRLDQELDIIDFNNFKSDNDDALAAKVSNTEFEEFKTENASNLDLLLSKDEFRAFVSGYDVAMSSKASQRDVELALNTKADITYVDEELAKKADKTNVYTKEEVFTKTQTSELIAAAIQEVLQTIREEINNG